MKTVSVPFAWLALSRRRRMDARFWIQVNDEVEAQGISRADLAQVQKVVRACELRGKRARGGF